MARTRKKTKGRQDIGRFLAIPHSVMEHPDWLTLKPNALRLLLELGKQYNGRNNGDLTAAWAIMQKRGFNSEGTLSSALNCLLAKNIITRTREACTSYWSWSASSLARHTAGLSLAILH